MTKYIVIGIVALCTVAILISCTDKKKKASTKNAKPIVKEKPIENTDHQNPYLDMRTMAFSAKAEQLGLDTIADDKVYGLITEISMNPGTASVIAFSTGDTSLYLSSGAGFIGAGQHNEVRALVSEKVDGFQKYLSQAEKVTEPTLPADGKVNFNFLTKNGMYSVSENLSELENGRSKLAELFTEVNEIISQIRIHSKG